MLIKKSITGYNGMIINTSEYVCDMCRKPLKKEQRILIGTTETGKDIIRKKWDLCEKCMKIIEKNIEIWYDKITSKK